MNPCVPSRRARRIATLSLALVGVSVITLAPAVSASSGGIHVDSRKVKRPSTVPTSISGTFSGASRDSAGVAYMTWQGSIGFAFDKFRSRDMAQYALTSAAIDWNVNYTDPEMHCSLVGSGSLTTTSMIDGPALAHMNTFEAAVSEEPYRYDFTVNADIMRANLPVTRTCPGNAPENINAVEWMTPEGGLAGPLDTQQEDGLPNIADIASTLTKQNWVTFEGVSDYRKGLGDTYHFEWNLTGSGRKPLTKR